MSAKWFQFEFRHPATARIANSVIWAREQGLKKWQWDTWMSANADQWKTNNPLNKYPSEHFIVFKEKRVAALFKLYFANDIYSEKRVHHRASRP